MKLVSWNPLSSDSFIVTNQKELHVYSFLKEEHKQNKEWNQEIHKMDFDETIHVKISKNLIQKSISWSPKLDLNNHNLISVGLKNGNLLLYNLQQVKKKRNFKKKNKIVKEFIPKINGRICFCSSWNPVKTNLIATGLDKTKTGSNIIIWDINSTGETDFERTK
jgi:hypothetical protein